MEAVCTPNVFLAFPCYCSLVTFEQRGFYLIPAIPLFIFGTLILLLPFVTTFIERINNNSRGYKIYFFTAILVFIFAIAFTLSCFGGTKRDEEMLPDIYALGKIIPHGDVVSIPNEILNEWSLSDYFARYFYISLDAGKIKHHYFMIKKDLPKNLVPKGYVMYPAHTTYVDLYVLNKK